MSELANAPAFEIEAAVSGVKVGPTGHKQVLVFHGPKTSDAPKQVGKAVRAAHPDAKDVRVANIVDLRSMSGMWQKVANASIKSTYEKMAAKVTLGAPEDYVIICPDWDGSVATAFGFDDPNKNPAAVVVAEDGSVVGVAAEGDLAEQVLAWL